MENIFTKVSKQFKTGSILLKYIYINAACFLFIRLAEIFMRLFLKEPSFVEYLQMPSSWSLLLYRPWAFFSYMFVHLDFLHILFNMLWLYWFGQIFLLFFTGRQFGGLYILGGLAGALLFLLSYNIFPLLNTGNSFLIGASAAVMAIVFAISFHQKDYTINLLLLGQTKLIYIAIGVLLLDILAISYENTGGHIAHIGGALTGIFFAHQYKKGKDITLFINNLIDKVVNITKSKPSFTVYKNSAKRKNNHRKPKTDDEYLRRKNEENRVIDEILDKLKRSGYENLSEKEKKILFNAGKK